MKNGLLYSVVFALVVFLPAVAFCEELAMGDHSDGSRAPAVHEIPLLDADGAEISPDDDPAMPFSMKETCGACHSYDTVSGGLHFNYMDPNVPAGRPGEPWIMVDAATGTQIPLSYRDWQGTFKPGQVQMTPWEFVKTFGGHMPGGGAGAVEPEEPEQIMRSFVSGQLEINCLACHNDHPGQDQGETGYAGQIARENFRWAGTDSCEFAAVTGNASKMPDTYDPLMGGFEEDEPQVHYDKGAFDFKERVLFEVAGEISADSCYFCHSMTNTELDADGKWAADEDIHMTNGMTCVDCHRGGVGHDTIRGYEGEENGNVLASVTTCESCHTLDGESNGAGRLGAPIAEHEGIPEIHFEKMTCTACHSGLEPGQQVHLVKTSRAHGLGLHSRNLSDTMLPHIQSPIYARNEDDKIAPFNMIWPAFWAVVDGNSVSPLSPAMVFEVAGNILADADANAPGDWRMFSDEQVAGALEALAGQVDGQVGYIAGGKLFTLPEDGALASTEHAAAAPFKWPVGHNVRAAAQSLGAVDCEQCHSSDSAFMFSLVAVDSPMESAQGAAVSMISLAGLDGGRISSLAWSFYLRPVVTIVVLAGCAVVAIVLLMFALRALAVIVKSVSSSD